MDFASAMLGVRNSGMEQDEQHVAEDYMQEFVLDHLEDVTVKREETQRSSPETVWDSVPGEYPAGRVCRSWTDELRLSPISPHHTYDLQPKILNMGLADPGTPPDTPAPSQYLLPSQTSSFVDETMCFYPNIGLEQQPMDSSMVNAGDWDCPSEYSSSEISLDNHNQRRLPHPMPQLCSSESSAVSSRMSINNDNSGYSACKKEMCINDNLLVSLSVKKLNVQLKDYSREDIKRIKQKRRTLKNQGYAQNSISKRQQLWYDLENANRRLREELGRTKVELASAIQERDILRQIAHISGPALPGSQTFPEKMDISTRFQY